MITTDKFVFIHMHKTGGQSLNHVLKKTMPSFREIGYHYPHHLLPAEYNHLPVIGMVRNPWDWYISWYAFNTRPNVGNPLFFILSDGCQTDFKQTITNLARLGSDDESSQHYRNALIEILPESLEGNHGVGLTKACIQELADSGEGYYSWQFKRMHGNLDNATTYIGRFENFESEFLSLMDKCAVDNINEIQQQLDEGKRLNASSHSHYSRYYDNELRELITEKDRFIIDRYGYTFETDGNSEALIKLPRKQIDNATDDFVKLDGKATNFLLMKKDVNIKPILQKLARIPEKTWNLSGREKTFEAHRQTQSLLLIHDDDFRHYNPTYCELYPKFEKELKPIIDFIADYYQHNGFIGRILIAKLRAGGKISAHADGLYSLVKCNRVHVPLITNSKAIFMIGGEEKVLGAGEMWEINNATLHAVHNQSKQDRVHLIIDWIPNETVRSIDKMPKHPPPAVATQAARPANPSAKVGRNDPCPCGSGKKFKQCHGKIR